MYKIKIRNKVFKEIQKLPKKDRQAIIEVIDSLQKNPRPHGASKMTNSPYWRLRVRKYRVIYDINDDKLVIIIIRAAHRKDVYDNLD